MRLNVKRLHVLGRRRRTRCCNDGSQRAANRRAPRLSRLRAGGMRPARAEVINESFWIRDIALTEIYPGYCRPDEDVASFCDT